METFKKIFQKENGLRLFMWDPKVSLTHPPNFAQLEYSTALLVIGKKNGKTWVHLSLGLAQEWIAIQLRL